MEGKKMPEAIGAVLDRIEAQQAMALQLGPNAISLDLLRAVYRCPSLALSVRIRAAGLAIPYETPKLIATAVRNEGSFADLLERRLKRFEEMKIIEAQPLIEAKLGGEEKVDGEKIDARLPPPIPDRRFRRI